jgi:GntR family transcriptional regulator/MocR family aminotransferase
VGGLEKLRQALVRHAALRGIPAHWDQVAVTCGGQEGLSSALGSFWSLGARKLWVEALTYPDVLEMARRQGYELGVLPQSEPDLVMSLSKIGPGDVFYCIPSFQNPTGRTLSLAARKAVLEASRNRPFWLIEDDTYGELRFGGESVPALKALSGSGQVLYIGSFSQLLFPGLRLGYALVPGDVNEEYLCLKASRGAFPSSLVQYLILAFIEERALEDVLQAVSSAMAIRMESLCSALERDLPRCVFRRPRGGIYLWLETPGLDGSEAVGKAAAWDVALSPGKTYSARGEPLEAVRFSVSRLEPRELDKAVVLLKEAWSDVSWRS